VRTVARARTLTVLRRLDPNRKTQVARFLVEAGLVQRTNGRDPIIILADADLRSTYLTGLDLRAAVLSDADLSGSHLVDTNLDDADLSNANLRSADLYSAEMNDAVMRNANLAGANLRLTGLSGAILSEAKLKRADLSSADLWKANLSDTNLVMANLNGALGWTEGQLASADSLEGATMPDGQLHAGTYVTNGFEPTLSFNIGTARHDGWKLQEEEMNDQQLLIEDSEGSQIIFTSPLHVFDPINPKDPKQVPAPRNTDGWVSWFQRHPNLDTSAPTSVTVGGAHGVRVDAQPSSTPDNSPQQCYDGLPCFLLYPSGEDEVITSSVKSKDRFVIVDVKGETVIIDIYAQANKFDEFLPKAQKLLDTVKWKGE